MSPKKIAFFLLSFIVLAGTYFFFSRKKVFDEVRRKQVSLEKELKQYQKPRKPGQSKQGKIGPKIALVKDPKSEYKKRQRPVVSLKELSLPPALRRAEGLFSFSNQGYTQLVKLRALPKREGIEEQLSEDQKLGEFRNHLIVKREAILNEGEGLPLVVNSRTQRMGIVTGIISVTFKDRESYDHHLDLIGKAREDFSDLPLSVRREFSHLFLVLFEIEGDFTLAELLKLEEWIKGQGVVSKAKAEVLEGGKGPL